MPPDSLFDFYQIPIMSTGIVSAGHNFAGKSGSLIQIHKKGCIIVAGTPPCIGHANSTCPAWCALVVNAVNIIPGNIIKDFPRLILTQACQVLHVSIEVAFIYFGKGVCRGWGHISSGSRRHPGGSAWMISCSGWCVSSACCRRSAGATDCGCIGLH